MGASLFSALFPALRRTSQRSAPVRRSAPLGLEVLEDRTVPSCTTVLGVGHNYEDVGSVTIEAFDNDHDNDVNQIIVTYQTTGDNLLSETHLWFGDIDLNGGPYGPLPTPPAPGQFPFKHELTVPSATDSYTIDIADGVFQCDDTISVVAHAAIRDIFGNEVGTAWGVGAEVNSERGGGNAQFFSCTLACEHEEEVFEGLSHGYWKNHLSDWQGFTPSQTIASAFGPNYHGAYGSTTLLQALNFTGGKDTNGAERILLRNAVASVLNATHENINYQLAVTDVISQVNTAINTHDRATMLTLEAYLDVLNNQEGDINS